MLPLLQAQVPPAVSKLPVVASSPLPDAIVATVAFFDCVDYPLTATEIHRWLWKCPARLAGVLDALPAMVAAGRLQQVNAFYTLPGRGEIVWTRHERYRIAERKFARARRAVRLLRHIPGVRLVAVCNTAAYANARRGSDVDLFIITTSGRIWWTRLLTVLLLQVAGLRRHAAHVADRCCLSFYLAADRLDLADVALTPHDPCLAYWVATQAPVFDRGGVFAAFWEANAWACALLPNATPRQTSGLRTILPLLRQEGIEGSLKRPPRHPYQPPLTLRGGGFGVWIEALAERLQRPRLQRWVSRWPDQSGVAIGAQILKLHVNDRRAEHRAQWLHRLAEHTAPYQYSLSEGRLGRSRRGGRRQPFDRAQGIF